MRSDEEQNPQHGAHPINESLIIDTVRIEAERQRHDQQERDEQNRQRQARHDRSMLLITIGLLVANLITGIAALYQAHSSSLNATAAVQAVKLAQDARDDNNISSFDTLLQMRAQSRSMYKSAQAAESASKTARATLDEMRAQSFAMGKNTEAAIVASNAAIRQAEISALSADAAEKSADAAVSQLEIAQRPWVDASVRIIGPLTFDANWVTISLRVALTNVGHSPAMAHIEPEFFVLNGRRSGGVLEIRRLCTSPAATNFSGGEEIVFPGKTVEPNITYKPAANMGEVRESSDHFSGALIAELVVCVAYRSGFDPRSSYYIGKSYYLRRNDPTVNNFDIFPGVNIPAEYILLLPDPLGSVAVR